MANLRLMFTWGAVIAFLGLCLQSCGGPQTDETQLIPSAETSAEIEHSVETPSLEPSIETSPTQALEPSLEANETISMNQAIEKEQSLNILIFSKTAGFRHDSISDAIGLFDRTAAAREWGIEGTINSDIFTDDQLANFDVVVFLLTTGDVLNDEQQAAFERFIQAGGGFVGIHSATDTEYDWPWYNGLVGAYFAGHPPIQTADILRSNILHPSTGFLPCRWTIEDEWYNFRTNPADNNEINILLWLDESTYQGGNMGDRHPIAWAREYDGGRSWYTAAGHRSELYNDPEYELFQRHIIAGVEWAAGVELKGKSEIKDQNLIPTAYLPVLNASGCASTKAESLITASTK